MTTLTQTEIDVIVKKILDNALEAYKELKIRDFFDCLVKIMECAEAIPKLVGTDKKLIVKSVLTQLIDHIPFQNATEKNLIVFLINSDVVDLLIDGIVKLTKEGCKINLKEVMKKAGCKCCIV
jgi:hypothetical protein